MLPMKNGDARKPRPGKLTPVNDLRFDGVAYRFTALDGLFGRLAERITHFAQLPPSLAAKRFRTALRFPSWC